MDASEPSADHHPLLGVYDSYSASEATIDHVLLRGGHLYQHNVFRINYTIYNVNHGQENFNLNSQHSDIIMLAENCESQVALHPFCYAWIIGIYHANVQYIGPGLKDYNAHQLDFLHVQWFKLVPPNAQCRVALDMLWLFPTHTKDTYGFVDPADVLRDCHLIPTFAKGQMRPVDTMSSLLSNDSDHWKYYYINK